MADYDDAEDIMGGSKERTAASQAVSKANNPLSKAWAWFSVQPAQSKVIIIGVIVVLGVVIWMALRKKSNPTPDASEDSQPGVFRPIGANRYGPGLQEAPPTALPPIQNTPVTSPISPGVKSNVSTGPAITKTTTSAPPTTPTPPPAPTPLPPAVRPPNIYPITPAGAMSTMHGTDVPLSGTTIPIISRVGAPKRPPTYVAPAAGVHTQRGQDVSY